MPNIERIESEWLAVATETILSHARDYPADEFYAAGFWLCYVDYTMFGTPCFAMETEAHSLEYGIDIRWAPPNWRFDVIDSAIERMIPHYEALTLALTGQSEAIWNDAIERHWSALARVCRRLTEDIRSHSGAFRDCSLPDTFVVGLFEEREPEPIYTALIRASIAPDVLSSLAVPILR